MRFRLRELEERNLPFRLEFPPGPVEFQVQQMQQVGPLETEGEAELRNRTLGEIGIRGRYRVTLGALCDRCLEPIRLDLAEEFDLLYRPAEHDVAVQSEVELDEDESEVGFYEGDGVDLADVLREQILLSAPMQRLCRPECQGICPRCGANRNTVACGCEGAKADDRWSALRGWKRDGDDRGTD